MHNERLNTWPSRESRPDLYVHNLKQLAIAARIVVLPTEVVAPAWKTVLDWKRDDSYISQRMSRKIARELVEAGFGSEGVLPWLLSRFPPNVMTAGREFFEALRKVGLNPEGLFWAFDTDIDEPALVLITSFYNQVGPFAINKLLFKAYNLSITPRSISPFIIRLYSPDDSVALFIASFIKKLGSVNITVSDKFFGNSEREIGRTATWHFKNPKPHFIEPGSADNFSVDAVGIPGTNLHAFAGGLYTWTPAMSGAKRVGQWQRIQQNVNSCAA